MHQVLLAYDSLLMDGQCHSSYHFLISVNWD